VKLAAELGCVSISTGLSSIPPAMMAAMGHPDFNLYPQWSLETDAALRRELKAAMADTGVHIGLGEGIRVPDTGDIRDRAPALDIMAELGAHRINAVSMEHDMARTYDQLGALADMVAERGMIFTVEFAPGNAIAALADALAAVEHIGRERCRVLLDSMHFFRSGGTVAELKALDPDLIGYAQLADAPFLSKHESYMAEAMFDRMVPGTGELPLADFIAALPDDCEIGLEIPHIADLKAGMTPHDHAARCVAAARALGA
jgi:sugar phosphate isomerase/epimerase